MILVRERFSCLVNFSNLALIMILVMRVRRKVRMMIIMLFDYDENNDDIIKNYTDWCHLCIIIRVNLIAWGFFFSQWTVEEEKKGRKTKKTEMKTTRKTERKKYRMMERRKIYIIAWATYSELRRKGRILENSFLKKNILANEILRHLSVNQLHLVPLVPFTQSWTIHP